MVTSGMTLWRRPAVLLPALIILMLAATATVTAADTIAVPTAVARSPQQEETDTTQAEGGGDAEAAPAAPRVVIELDKGGQIVMELLPDDAPIAIERFTALVKDGFYDGLRFHRVESWIIQTGKKDSDLEPIEGEMFFQDLKHDKGMVGMARLVDDYDSATTQFYIIKECKAVLNGEYTLFAKVIEGMDMVTKVKKGDKIKKIRFSE
jgi:cyclophilin family peptidyl-prolyl cis-trans isomerase